MYVGIDLHKKFFQVVITDENGKILKNEKVEKTYSSIKKYFKKIALSANSHRAMFPKEENSDR